MSVINNCFYELGYRILPDSLSQQLIKYSQEVDDQFYVVLAYKGGTRTIPDGNCVKLIDDLSPFPELIEISNKFTITPTQFAIVKQLPNTNVIKHTDRNKKRSTVIATPLSPIDNFPATHYYTSIESNEKHLTCRWKNFGSVIMNTQQPHGLTTDDRVRLNFQFSFSETFEEILSLVIKNELIKS
jgi:hypothetical protein